MTPRERVEQVARLRTVTSLPIVVDGEEGWGDAPHVAYWVREFEKAGAAGIMIDDKAGAFSTPYIEGTSREVESIDVAVRRLRVPTTFRSFADTTDTVPSSGFGTGTYFPSGDMVIWRCMRLSFAPPTGTSATRW